MAAFTYNEDGSLNWLDNNEMPKSETLVITEGPDRDAQFVPSQKKIPLIQHAKKKEHVDILINAFKKQLKPISQSFKEKYAKQIEDFDVLQYFYAQVIEWNERCPILIQELKDLEKQRQLEKSRFQKQQEASRSKKKKAKKLKVTFNTKQQQVKIKEDTKYKEVAEKLLALQKDFDSSLGNMFDQLQKEQSKLKGNSLGANFKIKA